MLYLLDIKEPGCSVLCRVNRGGLRSASLTLANLSGSLEAWTNSGTLTVARTLLFPCWGPPDLQRFFTRRGRSRSQVCPGSIINLRVHPVMFLLTSSNHWSFQAPLGVFHYFASCSLWKCWERSSSCSVYHLLGQKTSVQKVRDHMLYLKVWLNTISTQILSVNTGISFREAWFQLFVASRAGNAASNLTKSD